MANIKKIFENMTNVRMFTIQTLSKGLINTIYTVNDKYVLRVRRNYSPFISPKDELMIMQELKKTHLDFYCDHFDSHGNKVTIYEPLAVPFDPNKYTKEQIELIANSLRKIHDTPTKTTLTFNYLERLLYHQGIAFDHLFDKSIDRIVKANARKYFTYNNSTLCHNNLMAANILFIENEIRITDYQNAGLNDPFYDIAFFFASNHITDMEMITHFIKCYYKGYLAPNMIEKLKDYYLMIDYLLYFWAESMFNVTKDEEFIDIASKYKESINNGYDFLTPLESKK